MGNFNDFDLDIKKVEESNEKSSSVGGAITTIIVGSVLTGCSGNCYTRTCSKGCATPTKDRPALSCHKVVKGIQQTRC